MTKTDDLIARINALADCAYWANAGWDIPGDATQVIGKLAVQAAALLREQAAEIERLKASLHQANVVRDVFASSVVQMEVDKMSDLQGKPVDKSTKLQGPDPNGVICPNCVHQFRAIPENVQARLRGAEAEFAALIHDNARLVQANADLATDAERYRWLRESAITSRKFGRAYWREELDAAIDAARAGSKP